MSRRAMKVQGLRLLLVLGAASGCCKIFGCKPTPFAPESECWSPALVSNPLVCSQPDAEPNDTIPMAAGIAAPGCESAPIAGMLAGDDIDAFHAHGDRCDTGNPELQLGTKNIRACLFVQCSTGSTGANSDPKSDAGPQLCSDGSVAVHHPNGLLGCCLSKPGAVSLDVACSTVKKTLDAFVIVDGHPTECTPYDVTFHL